MLVRIAIQLFLCVSSSTLSYAIERDDMITPISPTAATPGSKKETIVLQSVVAPAAATMHQSDDTSHLVIVPNNRNVSSSLSLPNIDCVYLLIEESKH
jgi:hypothetical protein